MTIWWSLDGHFSRGEGGERVGMAAIQHADDAETEGQLVVDPVDPEGVDKADLR